MPTVYHERTAHRIDPDMLGRYNTTIMSTIDPSPASGFRDYLPDDAVTRLRFIEQLRASFARSGFAPIETPALERLPVLTGGDEQFAKQIYRARITDTDDPMGLRFDLTVPLARFVAAHANDLALPFRRYHIGPVWRGEHAQAGRYREFLQCDIDIIGTKSSSADADIIATLHGTLNDLGAGAHTFHINNRKVLNGLAGFAQFDERNTPAVLRTIDKLDKIGWDGVRGDLVRECGLDEIQADTLKAFLDIREGANTDKLAAARELLKFSPQAVEGLDEIAAVLAHAEALGVPPEKLIVDFTIARGLGYYTGTVVETFLDQLPQIGSVASGGRYDDLVSRFAPFQVSAVGASIGFDRLYAALDELKLLQRSSSRARVAVLNFEPAATFACEQAVAGLRAQGVSAELYVGNEDTLKGQLSWAVKGQVPIVIIIGKDEVERGVAQVKDMAARSQEEIPLAELPGRVR